MTGRASLAHLREFVDLGFPRVLPDFSEDLGRTIDIKAAPIIDGICTNDAADNHLRPLQHRELARNVSINMDAPAVFHGQIAINSAAHINLAAIDDFDVSGNRTKKIDRLRECLIALQLPAFLAHGSSWLLRRLIRCQRHWIKQNSSESRTSRV